MMDQYGPCGPTSSAMHLFIVVINVFQAIAIAFVTARAARKNREDRKANGNGTNGN